MVSTVRSSSEYLESDNEFKLGFVKNEKVHIMNSKAHTVCFAHHLDTLFVVQRFNVAITRAKALLIVVGNPRVLNADTTWARYASHGCSAFSLHILVFQLKIQEASLYVTFSLLPGILIQLHQVLQR